MINAKTLCVRIDILKSSLFTKVILLFDFFHQVKKHFLKEIPFANINAQPNISTMYFSQIANENDFSLLEGKKIPKKIYVANHHF